MYDRSQLMRGTLEGCILHIIGTETTYGYNIVTRLQQFGFTEVREGTIYPLLKRLTNEHYFETYLRESTEGPPRKYYHLTAAGVLYRDALEAEWDVFQEQVNRFLKEHRYEE